MFVEDNLPMKIDDFIYNQFTNNALSGLKNYIKGLLFPTYVPLKDGQQRTGAENEIEVRVYWTGKPRILPFIVLSVMGDGFKEDKKNFEMNDMIDEYTEEIDGVTIAFRERAIIGNLNIKCTMATEDANNRIKLSDFLIDKLIKNRQAFVYREGDGLSNSLISFTNSNYAATNFKEISAGSGDNITYLYFSEIGIDLNIQYNFIEQVFPGVVQTINGTGSIVPPVPVPPSPQPPIPPPSPLKVITSTGYFSISSMTNDIVLPHSVLPNTEIIFWNKTVQVRGVGKDYVVLLNEILFSFNLNINDEIIISYSYMG